MEPVSFTCTADCTRTSQTIRENFLDLSLWPGFTGWGPLPGIRQATFLQRTDAVRGSRIAVVNTDGSRHVEEIIEWSELDSRRFRWTIRLGEFTAPVRHLAREFVETWELTDDETTGGCLISRRLQILPRGRLSGLVVRLLIAPLLRRALQKHTAAFSA